MSIQSVHKAVSILNCFSLVKPVLAVGEISRLTGHTNSTVSRLLATLEERGCVEKTEGRGRYRLGYRTYLWGVISQKHNSLAATARPAMERLRDECKEEVALYVIEGVSRVCLEQAQSVHHLARHSSVGDYFPLHAGASGKVLLAYLPDEERKRILSQIPLERFTPRTVTDPEELERDLERIRKRGYAVSKGEREAGAYSIVAPVWNASGRVVASLTISGPIFRLSDKRLKANIRGVLAAAREVSERLGYRGEK